jgi:hypothetical protein
MVPTGGLTDAFTGNGTIDFASGTATHARIQGSVTLSTNKYQWLLFVADGVLYAMVDADDRDDIIYTIGSVGTSTTNVSMASNNREVVIVNDGVGYRYGVDLDAQVDLGNRSLYNIGTTILNIGSADADFTANGNPVFVTSIDGYFVFATDEKKIIVSAINNALSYNALDFASAVYDDDIITSLFVVRNQLHVAGTSTIEVFDNIGGTDFPFQRNGVFYDVGVIGPFSISLIDSTAYFIGAGKNKAPGLYSINGSGEEARREDRSTQIDLENITDGLGTSLSDSTISATAYTQDGHSFYVLRDQLNALGALVFDITTGIWHRRNRYPVRSVVRWKASLLCLVAGSSSYTPAQFNNRESMQEYGTASGQLVRELVIPPIYNEDQPFSIASLELSIEPGHKSGDEKMEFNLSVKRDAIDPETWVDLGTITMSGTNPERTRFIWRRLGRFDRYAQFRFQATGTDSTAVARPFVGLTADISQ